MENSWCKICDCLAAGVFDCKEKGTQERAGAVIIMNEKIVIYGAGTRGEKLCDMLLKQSIMVDSFCDINYESIKFIKMNREGEQKIPVISPENLTKDMLVVIGIANDKVAKDVREELTGRGIRIAEASEVLYGNKSENIANNRRLIADYHLYEMQDYFETAERMTDIFWNSRSVFYDLFKILDLKNVVELACGKGRHVDFYKKDAGHIVLVDILEDNIEYCKQRFRNENNISYYNNSGNELKEIESESQTALFTYDAMVHFEMMDIWEYLKETNRILVHGGRALFHHSNNTEDYRINFMTGRSGRNYMSSEIFAYLTHRAGLRIIEQKLVDWNGKSSLDCLTLVEKN